MKEYKLRISHTSFYGIIVLAESAHEATRKVARLANNVDGTNAVILSTTASMWWSEGSLWRIEDAAKEERC